MAEEAQRCLGAAERYLAYRPRSVAEMRGRLRRRGFDEAAVEAALAGLAGRGLLDDRAFARFWVDNRQAFGPRSRWVIARELREKGLDEAVIGEALGGTDDEDSATRAAVDRARRLPADDIEVFRRRLGAYLRRRGYSYDIITRAVGRAWRERSGQGIEVS